MDETELEEIFVIIFAIFALIVVVLIEVRFCGDHGRFFSFANHSSCTLAPEVRPQNT